MYRYAILVLAFSCGNLCRQIPENAEGELPDPDFHLERLGFPSKNSLRYFENYVLSYDNRLRLASWVFEHLNSRTVESNKNLTGFGFKEDRTIHSHFRARDADYRRNYMNLTRGHLAAAANHQISYQLKQNTYFFSNVAPQIGSGFNSGMWSSLELWVRRLTSAYTNVFVVTGPLFLPLQDETGEYVTYRLLGTSRIAIPTHFFKVVLAEKEGLKYFDLWAFILPHEKIAKGSKLDSFVRKVVDVEKLSGLIFFDKVPSNKIHSHNTTKVNFYKFDDEVYDWE